MDTRQINSRKKIVSALCSLLEDQGYAEISMSAVSKHAGVSRQTLYTHFATKTEIVQAYMEGWFASLEESFRAVPPPDPANDEDALSGFLTRIIQMNAQDYHMRRVIFSGQAGPDALKKVRGFVVNLLAQRMSLQPGTTPPETLQIFALFATFGVSGVTDALADGTIEGTPEDIAAALAKFVNSGLRGME